MVTESEVLTAGVLLLDASCARAGFADHIEATTTNAKNVQRENRFMGLSPKENE
jgi:hypothetical protein